MSILPGLRFIGFCCAPNLETKVPQTFPPLEAPRLGDLKNVLLVEHLVIVRFQKVLSQG